MGKERSDIATSEAPKSKLVLGRNPEPAKKPAVSSEQQKKDLSPDQKTWNELYSTIALVKKTPSGDKQERIQSLVDKAKSTGFDFKTSPLFQEKLAYARKHPTSPEGVLTLQIYGKEVLGDQNVSVDGIFGKQTESVLRYMQSNGVGGKKLSEKTVSTSSYTLQASSSSASQETAISGSQLDTAPGKDIKKSDSLEGKNRGLNAPVETGPVALGDPRFAQNIIKQNPALSLSLAKISDPKERYLRRSLYVGALRLLQTTFSDKDPVWQEKNTALQQINSVSDVAFDGDKITLSDKYHKGGAFSCTYDIQTGQIFMNSYLQKHTTDQKAGYTLSNLNQQDVVLSGLPSLQASLPELRSRIEERTAVQEKFTRSDLKDICIDVQEPSFTSAQSEQLAKQVNANYLYKEAISLLPVSLQKEERTQDQAQDPLFLFSKLLHQSANTFSLEEVKDARLLLDRFSKEVVPHYQDPLEKQRNDALPTELQDPWFSLFAKASVEQGIYGFFQQETKVLSSGEPVLDLRHITKSLKDFDQNKHFFASPSISESFVRKRDIESADDLLHSAYV